VVYIYPFQALVTLMEIPSGLPPPPSHSIPPPPSLSPFFHTVVYIVGRDGKRRCQGKKRNVSASLRHRFDPPPAAPPYPSGEHPGGSRALIWVFSPSVLTKYRVSATRISRCDRLTEWALAPRTLIQQRAPRQAVIYPKPADSVAHFRGRGGGEDLDRGGCSLVLHP